MTATPPTRRTRVMRVAIGGSTYYVPHFYHTTSYYGALSEALKYHLFRRGPITAGVHLQETEIVYYPDLPPTDGADVV